PTEVGNRSLLRVELDDQLFLHRHLDLRALGKLVHENPEIRRHDLQPRRNRAVTQRFLRSDERQCLQRLRTNVDDVELRHPVAGDVDLLALDEEVAVAAQLPGRRTGGALVHENAEIRRHDLQPRRNRAFTRRFLRSDERQCLQRLRTNVDDVELRHPVAGDVDLLAVDEEVAVADQLTGLTTGPRKTSAVHDVVQPRFQELKQVVTGLSGAPRSFLVVAPELALEDAVGVAGLLLLLQLQQVFAFLHTPTAVLAGRVGATFERLVVADEVN